MQLMMNKHNNYRRLTRFGCAMGALKSIRTYIFYIYEYDGSTVGIPKHSIYFDAIDYNVRTNYLDIQYLLYAYGMLTSEDITDDVVYTSKVNEYVNGGSCFEAIETWL